MGYPLQPHAIGLLKIVTQVMCGFVSDDLAEECVLLHLLPNSLLFKLILFFTKALLFVSMNDNSFFS